MKISARNQLKGTISSVTEGAAALAIVKSTDVIVGVE